MQTAEFHFDLPEELIAQRPVEPRDHSRLLVVDRTTGQLTHQHFRDILEQLDPESLLVMNDSRVIPARLRATNPETGGAFEILLLEEVAKNEWWAMMRPGKRANVGRVIELTQANKSEPPIHATVLEVNPDGHRRLRFSGVADLLEKLEQLGEIPLPPYIERAPGPSHADDIVRYQTVYANAPGSIAAPTAGLHFTPQLLEQLQHRGIEIATVTLHVGVGTFAPVKSSRVEDHVMHSERFFISKIAAKQITQAIRDERPIVAVGTTSVRVLESAELDPDGSVRVGWGRTQIFITPPYTFKRVNRLLTNFHLPESTLLMLVSAFAAPGEARGRELILDAYAQAIEKRYRFFSYGDAMLLK